MSSTLTEDITGIYNDYSEKVYRYIYHRLGNRSIAEDLTGEVFLRFIRSGAVPDNVAAYLYRCAHNVIVDFLRHNPVMSQPFDEQVAAHHSDPAHHAEIECERNRLRHAISRLTPDQQQVIVLKYIEGLSNIEIGIVLERPEGAVKALQHRALVSLRTLLSSDKRQETFFEFARLLEG